jgi:hypothetical protein
VNVIVDLQAVRPDRLADGVALEALTARVRDLRDLLRGARNERLPNGVRLLLHLDAPTIARLADLVRAEADALPFLGFRLMADPPACRLEVTGRGRAGELAQTLFGELAR